MAIKVRIMAVSGVGELEGSCDGKQMQLKFYGTGNVLALELSFTLDFSLNSAFSLYKLLYTFHN